MIQLTIDCIPVSWSAPIKGKHGFWDKKHKEKEQARWQLQSQYRDSPIQGPYSVDFIFFLPIPKATSKAKRKQMAERRILPAKVPDATNMQKLYEDCLQGIVVENDSHCIDIRSRKFYSEKPGVSITVRTWEEQVDREHEITRALAEEKKQNHWIKV